MNTWFRLDPVVLGAALPLTPVGLFDTVWTDLVERGFNHKRTIVFWKFDRDPAIRLRWS